MKNIDEIKICFIEDIKQNELMSKKHNKACRILNYIEHLLILIYTVIGCVSIPAFASLVDILIGITSSVVRQKICVITAGIKKYNTITMKNKKKHDEIVLLGKSKLNVIKVLISKALIDSNISHD